MSETIETSITITPLAHHYEVSVHTEAGGVATGCLFDNFQDLADWLASVLSELEVQ